MFHVGWACASRSFGFRLAVVWPVRALYASVCPTRKVPEDVADILSSEGDVNSALLHLSGSDEIP